LTGNERCKGATALRLYGVILDGADLQSVPFKNIFAVRPLYPCYIGPKGIETTIDILITSVNLFNIVNNAFAFG